MLLELNVANFAVIEKLGLQLQAGFNVITGETGAGKSILIDALSGLLGARLGAEFVRTGAEAARVEGIFQIDAAESSLAALLAELGIEPEDGTLIISRDVGLAGRSVARVNGRAVPAATLTQLAPHLVDIHGQSDNVSLLRGTTQLRLLDAYAGLDAARAEVGTRVVELRRVRRDREALRRDDRELARQMDLLRFQCDEIEAAAPRAGEDEALEAERSVLSNAERLIELAETAYVALYEGTDELRPANELLGQASDALAEIGRLDEGQSALADQARAFAVQAAEVAREVRAYRDRIEVDPGRLVEVEERLEFLRTLKRKYGATVDEILAFQARASAELEALAQSESREADLTMREAALLADAAALAAELSARRRAAAAGLAAAVESQLVYLNMGAARFGVDVSRTASADGLPIEGACYAFDANGVDRVEFLVAPNPGEPLRPLARIASGGETARLMLALKATLAEVDEVPVLIFDEVDAGVGGRSGHVIGEKLAELSHNHQVICVTHLPQIASFADAHYRIAKTVEGDRTRTTVARLDEADRVEELAAMLGGTRYGVEQARSLIERARAWRESAPAGARARRPTAVTT